MILFEDELHDNGMSTLSVRMVNCKPDLSTELIVVCLAAASHAKLLLHFAAFVSANRQLARQNQ